MIDYLQKKRAKELSRDIEKSLFIERKLAKNIEDRPRKKTAKELENK